MPSSVPAVARCGDSDDNIYNTMMLMNTCVLTRGEASGMTAREKEILDLIATGATDKEIAAQLALSLHTVKSHVRSILSKTHAINRRQAAKLAGHSP